MEKFSPTHTLTGLLFRCLDLDASCLFILEIFDQHMLAMSYLKELPVGGRGSGVFIPREGINTETHPPAPTIHKQIQNTQILNTQILNAQI